MQRISDLFTRWHGANQGRISVFPAAALAETSSPDLPRAVRAFAEKHDLGSQSRSRTIISHQAAMAANRGVIPPIPALRPAGCPIANGTDNNTNDLFEVTSSS